MAINPASPSPLPSSGGAVQALAIALGLPFVEKLADPTPPRDLFVGDFDRIVGSWGRQFSTIPIDGDEHSVTVATSNPADFTAIDQLRVCYQRPVKVVVTTAEEITRAINAIRTSLMSDRTSALSSQAPTFTA